MTQGDRLRAYAIYTANVFYGNMQFHSICNFTARVKRPHNRLFGHSYLLFVTIGNGAQSKSDDSARRTIPTSRQVKPWSPTLFRYRQRAHHTVPRCTSLRQLGSAESAKTPLTTSIRPPGS
jgi:hypothetical protein